MSPLGFERYRDAIAGQTELLRDAIVGQDMTVPVPSCPGWNVGQLVRLRATDADVSWVMDDVLLAIFRRFEPDSLHIDGDRAWLEFWLERVAFA